MSSLYTSIAKGELPRISDSDALRLFADCFPDLSHLKNADPTVESSSSTGSKSWTPSRAVFGEDFTEVNRTLVSMLAVKWLLADDYEAFTGGQPEAARLSRASFQSLREFSLQGNPSSEDIYALLVALVIDDIGKDPALAQEVEEMASAASPVSPASPASPASSDHSGTVLQAAQAGLVSSLRDMPRKTRMAVLQNLELGSRVNIAQVLQGETAPASLAVLQQIPEADQGFHIRATVTFLDVAGAAAHRNPHGCVVMTESVFRSYMATIQRLDEFRRHLIDTPRACYDQVLTFRANTLHECGFGLLSTDNSDERALLRLLSMGRVENKDVAERFQRAFNLLADPTRRVLVDGLSVDGIDDGVAVVPYYAPGLLSEILKKIPKHSEDATVQVLAAYMSFLARVFGGSTPQPGKLGGLVERDVSFALATVESSEFKENPDILASLEMPWEKDDAERRRRGGWYSAVKALARFLYVGRSAQGRGAGS
ncbi:hypothetical protein P168DRAFT_289314 [Aspergillus campestris IBT 28561]|uniref:Uncharacterized protein n=1 Tax=Aspergillus campestris (strain IBT 28561) TaxID=1392248 RepID=A0A2I1D7Q7_ASPC2|nr:uncharacterized protein P168DRAFT_289314 [Aspergillus campestris IBT 28561]PKY05906.1 hypothetical protein P168DRAFT_289314 [Aspergillus campestris IBT 28561]